MTAISDGEIEVIYRYFANFLLQLFSLDFVEWPINKEWEWQGGKPSKLAEPYFKYLNIYKRVLEEEEAKMLGYEERELSNLVKGSQELGTMWLHMLISVRFNDHRSFPFTQLRQHVGEKK
ncbi:hypothetical protein NKR23_g12546 [Pleurostoma richardsiae]|uniref:Uncharacterized protein n=1 Tax=Pleurostoma richardsiae TaxID=41990 RepID=A0AA38VI43_9PEZI|nr:hypothetical protein NKR23_g12546 [Pleurostoma richardsiae]